MSVIRRDGTARVKIISPGVGSSGFYSPEVLAKSADRFKGASCFWNHPTLQEDAQRPERSLRDLAGKIVGTPMWDANGKTGPGIYADVQVFKPYRESVEELAPHIGMSIRATGKARTGDVAGRKMPIVEGIETVKSVDFVTLPGRGGEILQLFEAARARTEVAPKEMTPVELSEVQTQLSEARAELAEARKQTTEAQARNAQMADLLLLREARDVANSVLADIRGLPPMSRQRLAEEQGRDPIKTDKGMLDVPKFTTRVKESATRFLAELESISPGLVRGMGSGQTTADDKELDGLLESAFLDLTGDKVLAGHALRGH